MQSSQVFSILVYFIKKYYFQSIRLSSHLLIEYDSHVPAFCFHCRCYLLASLVLPPRPSSDLAACESGCVKVCLRD